VPPGSAEWAAVAPVAERAGAALAPSTLGVDVILTPTGDVVVLEVNAAPGYWFHDDQAGLADLLARRALARLGVPP
jgi:glutathione synthase/RimK-type ligase-like ATP-grasp enzyme